MSLFNRPAWAKSEGSKLDESESNIFRHSDRSYRDIVAEQERKKKEKAEKRKEKEERRTSEKHKIKDEPAAGDSLAKRRRITFEDGEALLSSVGLSSEVAVEADNEGHELDAEAVENPVRRSPRINRHANRLSPQKPKKRNKAAQVVDLGDSDGGEVEITHSAPAPAAQTMEEESDEEFAELARRARHQRQQKELQDRKSGTPDNTALSPSPAIDTLDTGQRSLPTPPPDPVVQLFISSRIPNTNPLIVQRKLSQRMEEIRKAWCNKQGFSEAVSKDVFFVHRMRRIYDVTTCRSLGLDVDAFGNLTLRGAEGKEGVEKVHLEAVTDEIFKQMKAERAREAKQRSGEPTSEQHTEAGATNDDAVMQQANESLIRITMKAKGREDFKLKVKPNTTFAKIAGACSKTWLQSDQSLWLEFDGERLDPEDDVQSMEIADLDCIHVHIA